MRIGVLGGCGAMGSRTVEVLAARDEVDEVVVLDQDSAGGQRLRAATGATFRQVDATQRSGLVAALRGLDAVASALGPFYRFERPLAEAALEAGVAYASICDDHDATAAVLELDDAARERGVPLLTGCGWTPGLTNLAARRIHDELGGLDAVRVFWAGAASDASGHAVVLHTLHVFSGHVPAVRDGLTEQVLAGSAREPVVFPEPIGTVQTCAVGHPEPVTLPRFLPGLRRVELKGGLVEAHLNVLARAVVRARLTRTEVRRERLTRVLEPLLPTLERLGQPTPAVSAWRVDGAHAGTPRSYWGLGRMRDLTGVPLAVAALLLARGELDQPGVHAPEADTVPHARIWELLGEHAITAERPGAR